MPVDCGSITPSRAHAATAASAAVPPARSTSIAVSAASGCEVATIAFTEWTVDRPGRWKFLIPGCSLLSFYRCFSGFSLGGIRRGPTWHIHAAGGNGGRRIAQYQCVNINVVPANAGTQPPISVVAKL